MIATVLVGTLNVSLVPSFLDISEREGKSAAWLVMSRLCTILLWTVGGITIAIVLTAPIIVKGVLAPLYSASQVDLTISLLQLSTPSIFFLVLAGVLTSLLYAQSKFALGGISVVANNMLILCLAIMLAPDHGIGVVAIGLSLGAAAQFLIVYVALRNEVRLTGCSGGN